MITVYRWDVFTTAGRFHAAGVTIGSEQDARAAAEKSITSEKDSEMRRLANYRITVKFVRQLPRLRHHAEPRTEQTRRKKGRLS